MHGGQWKELVDLAKKQLVVVQFAQLATRVFGIFDSCLLYLFLQIENI